MNIKKKIEDIKAPPPPQPKLSVKAIPLYVEVIARQTYRSYGETFTVPEARRLVHDLSEAIEEAVRLGRETLHTAEKGCCHEHS